MIENDKKHLIITKHSFIAPNGFSYNALFGTANISLDKERGIWTVKVTGSATTISFEFGMIMFCIQTDKITSVSNIYEV